MYLEEQMEIEEINQTQKDPWLVNNVLFCYKGKKHTGNESERKQHKEKHSNSKQEEGHYQKKLPFTQLK